MTYIYTEHSVGGVRYIYDSDADTVHRVKVTKITATNSDTTSSEFNVFYTAKGRSGAEFVIDGKDLHTSANRAFPEMPAEPEAKADEGGAA